MQPKCGILLYGNIYIWAANVHLLIMVFLHDFLWAGNDEFKCNIVEKLCEKFQVGNIQFKLSNMLA